jgi:aryl-alcohol dehydrogenase-like predicted oxidoreductase
LSAFAAKSKITRIMIARAVVTRSPGRMGLFVSEIGLGTMTIGGRGVWSAIRAQQPDEADRSAA